MKRVVRQVSRSGYQKLAKPLLFRQHPDKAHEDMIKAARALHRVRGENILRVWNYRNSRLEQEILGLKFKNPLGMSAGLDNS